jgi:hypothetical protein
LSLGQLGQCSKILSQNQPTKQTKLKKKKEKIKRRKEGRKKGIKF